MCGFLHCLFTGESFVGLLVFLIGHVNALFDIFDVLVNFLTKAVSGILERFDMETILNMTIVTVGLSLLGLTHVYNRNSMLIEIHRCL